MKEYFNFQLFLYVVLLFIAVDLFFSLRSKYILSKKKLERKKVRQQRTNSVQPVKNDLPVWPLVVLTILFFAFPVGIFFVLKLFYLKIEKELKEIKIPDNNPVLLWINQNLLWLFLTVVLVSAIVAVWKFRNYIPKINVTKIKKEIAKIKFNWKWLWIIPTLVLIYFIYQKWRVHEAERAAWIPNVVIGNSQRSDPLIGSPYLNMNGENIMQKDKFFQFDVSWDEPAISFDPETDEKVVLYFQKAEDPTRCWRLYLWKNEQGQKEYLFSPVAPIAELLIGKIYVKSEISSVNVVVSRK